MSTRLKPYPSYKDSGVEWLGRIPARWQAMRLKWLLSKIGSGKTPKGGGQIYSNSGVLFLRSQNVHFNGLRLDDVAYISESIHSEMATTCVRKGDVLLNITGASLGRCGPVPDDLPQANVSQHVCILRPRRESVLQNFLSRSISSEFVQTQIFADEVGTSREGLAFEQIANLLLAVPDNLEEQQAIGSFLDRETGKIDALVKKKERLIELLQEQRTALISHAVTQGLNPNAPKKDSGIPWLGHIPVHWGAMRLKFLLHRIDQGWSPVCDNHPAENGQWGVLKAGCANGGVFNPNENKTLPDDIQPLLSIEVKKGDVLMSRASGSTELVGSVAIVQENPPTRLLLSDKTFRLVVRSDRIEPELLVWAMGTPALRHQISEVTSGAEGLASNIGKGDIYNLVLPLPPRPEQAAICHHIDLGTAKLDTLATKVRAAIERLQEYRTALISAAVTGQIDVRHCGGA